MSDQASKVNWPVIMIVSIILGAFLVILNEYPNLRHELQEASVLILKGG